MLCLIAMIISYLILAPSVVFCLVVILSCIASLDVLLFFFLLVACSIVCCLFSFRVFAVKSCVILLPLIFFALT